MPGLDQYDSSSSNPSKYWSKFFWSQRMRALLQVQII